MSDAVLVVIFVVVFYFVFRTIWRNVTTVSYNGLSGFIDSWWSQILWAFFISLIITGIIGGILEVIINFFGQYGGKIVGGLSLVAALIIAHNLPDESNLNEADTFDKKAFMNNYNNHVIRLGGEAKIHDRLFNYKSSAEPGDSIAEGIASETRQGAPLTLTEGFLTEKNGVKLLSFPNASALYDDDDKPNIFFLINLSEGANVNGLERLFMNIILTAAIETVEPGKSAEIEREMNLIDDKGRFYLPQYNSEETILNTFTAFGKAEYSLSRHEDFVTFSIYK